MPGRAFSTFTGQVAERLRQGMAEGRWKGTLPSRKQLAEYLGRSQWAVEEATQRLTKEGLLASQGAGRRRRIVRSEQRVKPRALWVKLLLYEASDRMSGYILELVDHLVELGHRRIVMLVREERRKPGPGFLEQLFLDQLDERGIAAGPYNLPDWGDRPIEFHRMLDSLFQYTPPTALIVDQPVLCVAVLQHLASLGIKAPKDVSIACTDLSESFEWCVPRITHITWDSRPFINQVVRWADNISRGKDDRRKSSTKASLVVGGTIGPAKESR